MDYLPHFHREALAFAAAARRTLGADEAPIVPSCPDWSMSDLVIHLGGVHRAVIRVVSERLSAPPDTADLIRAELPVERDGWQDAEHAPNRGPVPASLIDWFAAGAATLEATFRDSDPNETVWTWSREQTVGFWLRMQTIEAAVHRWDAENAVGMAQPVETELAEDAISQSFEVMAPARRDWHQAPPAAGERFGLRQTDGDGSWTVHFDGEVVRFTEGPGDVELAGSASDLMLFLWQRVPADRLEVKGDHTVLDRYFTLVPPV